MLFGRKKKVKPKPLPHKSYKPIEPPPQWKPTFNKVPAKEEKTLSKE